MSQPPSVLEFLEKGTNRVSQAWISFLQSLRTESDTTFPSATVDTLNATDVNATTVDVTTVGATTVGATTVNSTNLTFTIATLPGGQKILGGAGSPNGAVSAPMGSIFLRTDGGASTTLYVKTSGTGTTTWTAK